MSTKHQERPTTVPEEPEAAISAMSAVSTESGRASRLLDEVEAPAASAEVTLTSGRRYKLQAGEGRDQLTVLGRGGEVVLRIEVTDQGPVLSFTGASIDLAATKTLRLSADEVTLRAERDMTLEAGGSLRERIEGDHHTRVSGDERLEASRLELQASAGPVVVRAMEKVSIDGEHIGLNDEPLPQPFPWSAIACDSEATEDK